MGGRLYERAILLTWIRELMVSKDNPDPSLFAQEVRNSAGSTISLGVWSAKGQRIREIYVPVPHDAALGLSLQWSPLSVTEDVWHILDVTADSPADNAGLLPYSDYVIGSPEGLVRGEGGLGELVEDVSMFSHCNYGKEILMIGDLAVHRSSTDKLP